MADGDKLHDQSQRIYSEPCMGRQRINVILSSSHNVIYCARHISAHCVYLVDGMKSTGDKTGMVVGAMKYNGG